LGRLLIAALAAVLTASIAAAPASACYTGLTIIPTAETVGAGQYAIEPQLDGGFPARGADTRIINTQFGFGERVEAGVDYDLSEEAPTRVLLNAKYLLAPDTERAPGLAVGICNIGRDVKSAPYAVATHGMTVVRGHLGVSRIEGANCWFVGMDRALTDRVVVMADYLSGAENFSAVGASYQFSERFGVLAGALFPNTRGEETRFTVHLVFTAPYRHADEE